MNEWKGVVGKEGKNVFDKGKKTNWKEISNYKK